MINDAIQPIGNVERIIEFIDGSKEVFSFKNTILKLGKNALANSITNNLGTNYSYYINSMIWGNGGTSGNAPKFVNAERTGLFSVSIYDRPVIALADGSQAIFTSVIPFATDNMTLNEMALVMANGDLYSMVTFPDLNKTNSMQITWNWRISYI